MGLEQLLKIEIAELSSTNKQKLLDNLQEKYSICIQNGGFEDFKVLQGLTGIKPDENVVQKGYSACIQRGMFKDFKVLQGLTGIKPDKNVVQNGYFACIQNGRFKNFKVLQGL